MGLPVFAVSIALKVDHSLSFWLSFCCAVNPRGPAKFTCQPQLVLPLPVPPFYTDTTQFFHSFGQLFSLSHAMTADNPQPTSQLFDAVRARPYCSS